ncbi:MAG TPA: hypothetical protein VGF99_01065 [Myxococcota bacterium]
MFSIGRRQQLPTADVHCTVFTVQVTDSDIVESYRAHPQQPVRLIDVPAPRHASLPPTPSLSTSRPAVGVVAVLMHLFM